MTKTKLESIERIARERKIRMDQVDKDGKKLVGPYHLSLVYELIESLLVEIREGEYVE